MNTWSQRRKRIILSTILSVLIFLIGLPLFYFLYRSPTCSDGKRNGDETGIDCGGGCELLCQSDNLPILLKGDPQVIRVSTTTHALIIQAENPNIYSDILGAGYTFKVYDASSTVPLRVIDGSTYVPKNGIFAIFVGPLETGEVTPTRAVFEWRQDTIVWNKNMNEEADLIIQNKILSGDTEPRLSADLVNQSLETVKNVEMTALLLDDSGNTIGASKTFVDTISKGETVPIIFTWPAQFSNTPTTIEILIKILPNKSFL